MGCIEIFKKFEDVVPYVFFGACTTAVNVMIFLLANYVLNIGIMISTCLAWIVAVTFAYFTNRKWVFHSEIVGYIGIIKELVSFFCCRAGTGIVDFLFMFLFAEILGFNSAAIKFISDIVVIVLNYIASKFYVFKKRL